MNLESLKSSKFEAFKGSELQSDFLPQIKGGIWCNTTYNDNKGKDKNVIDCTGDLYDLHSNYDDGTSEDIRQVDPFNTRAINVNLKTIKYQNYQHLKLLMILIFIIYSNIELFGQTRMNAKEWYEFNLFTDTVKKNCFQNYISKNDYSGLIIYTQSLQKENKISTKLYYENLFLGYYNLNDTLNSNKFLVLAYTANSKENQQNIEIGLYGVRADVFPTNDFIYYKPAAFNHKLINSLLDNEIEIIRGKYKENNVDFDSNRIQLVKLQFYDQYIRNRLDYFEYYNIKDSMFKTADSINANILINLWTKNKGFLNTEKAGGLSFAQLLCAWHINNDSIRINFIEPILMQAYKKGDITANQLISQLIRTKNMRGEFEINSKKYYDIVESMCKLFGIKKEEFCYLKF